MKPTDIQIYRPRPGSLPASPPALPAPPDPPARRDALPEPELHVVRLPRARRERRHDHLRRRFFRGVDVLRAEQHDTQPAERASRFDRRI